MCLSDAYEIRDGKENLVCSRVCNVSADGENVTLTDLMGDPQGHPRQTQESGPDEQCHPHRGLLNRSADRRPGFRTPVDAVKK